MTDQAREETSRKDGPQDDSDDQDQSDRIQQDSMSSTLGTLQPSLDELKPHSSILDSSSNLVTSGQACSRSRRDEAPSSINIHGSNNYVVVIQGSNNELTLSRALSAHLPMRREDEHLPVGEDKEETGGGNHGDSVDSTDDCRPASMEAPLTLHTKDVHVLHNKTELQVGSEDLANIACQGMYVKVAFWIVYSFLAFNKFIWCRIYDFLMS